jgi:glycerol-3-phosphate acyltransferase PlsY
MNALSWPSLLLCAALAYLAGSIPFGLVLTRLAGHGDIRRIGSGNIGATNVLRTGDKKLALLTLLLDGAKGAVATLVAARFGPTAAIVAAGASVIGHMFPVWLRFRGGKGVATALGVLLALSWPVGLAAAAVWLATAFLTRYSSLAALIAAAATPLVAWFAADPPRTALIAGIAALVILRHHSNIRRLVRGEESRIKLGKA